jgi:hypothetical protein
VSRARRGAAATDRDVVGAAWLPRSPAARGAILWAGFALLALGLYASALRGPFFSDDLHYVSQNPYVTGPVLERWREILDPRGEPVTLTENYTPVHLLLHAAAWRLFGPAPAGHHVVNVLLHAGVAALLVALLRRSGLPALAALGGGAFFLVHPGVVEAVAWVSQLKSTSSLVFGLSALLLLERRPALATAAFVLALFAKPTSAFVLPVAVLFVWCRRGDGAEERRRWLWLGVWTALFAAFAWVEMIAFTRAVAGVAPIHPDPGVRLRTSLGFLARYAAMGATGFGASGFHEPLPALSPVDPWFLAALALIAGLGARTAVTLWRRREEGVWWSWAAIAFLPVAQIWPFPFPFADRYLYPILPGLIGGALLAAQDVGARLGLRRTPALRRAGLVAALIVLAVLGARAADRARLFGRPELLVAESAAKYPHGVNANLQRARQAMQAGDAAGAVAALRGAYGRGYERFERILADPTYAPLHDRPDFQTVMRDMAGRWVARLGGRDDLSQAELFSLGVAHALRGEIAPARAALERALARGGPLDAQIRAQLAALSGA